MNVTYKAKIKLLLVVAYLSFSGVACCQDRVWTNTEGQQITARAVSKDENSVTLKLQDGKRVPVELEALSNADLEWLNKWKPPIITVSAFMKGGANGREKRRFKFDSSDGCKLVIFEDELPDVIAALKDLIELAQKPVGDVKSYEKVLHKGQQPGVIGEANVVVFRIKNGKAYCGGWVTGSYVSKISTEKLLPFLDFFETFSVRDWERKKEEIERRFKK